MRSKTSLYPFALKDIIVPATILTVAIIVFCISIISLAQTGAETDIRNVVINCFSQTDTLRSDEISALYPEILIGDANGNGSIDIDDGVFIVDYCLGGGPPPPQYSFVTPHYVRTWSAMIVLDTLGDSLMTHPELTIKVFYSPCADSGSCR